MNEKCVLGQNGQFDLFVIDDAILFGVFLVYVSMYDVRV